jgi:very-short-patch-repair endonuclease
MTEYDKAASPERATFDTWRGLLIDRTRRNRLLNYAHPSRETAASPLRIIDSDLSKIWALLEDGRPHPLCPLPDPGPPPPDERRDPFLKAHRAALKSDETYLAAVAGIRANAPDAAELRDRADTALRERVRSALGMGRRIKPDATDAAPVEAYARGEGYRPEFDLTTGHRGIAPQQLTCLALPRAFEKRAERLLRKAAEVERETGVATLHLALGFLEWTEADSSETTLASPLLLLPIALGMRKTATGRNFTIGATDSQPSPNLALGLRLEEEFGIRLPAFNDDAADPIGTYLAAVARIAENRSKWTVRNFATVALFSYARIAMWRDLDASNWSQGVPWRHPLAQPILRGSGGGQGAGGFGDDHDPDDPGIAPIAPILVQDCDSSQHSAIIEAMRGQTLVIEGPPGTGKSQTIANLIANALYTGKTVLFVAEKQAALEVVRKRLDATGLGQFCLSLHGPGAKPADAIAALKERVQAPSPRPVSRRSNTADVARGNLQQHLDVMHTTIEQVGASAHGLIGRLARLEQAHPGLPRLLRAAVARAAALPKDISLDAARLALTALQDAARQADGTFRPLTGSPWQRLTRSLLQHEQDDLLDRLGALSQVLSALRQADDEFAKAAEVPVAISAADAAVRVAQVAELDPEPSGAWPDVLEMLGNDPQRMAVLRNWLVAAEAARTAGTRIFTLAGERFGATREELSALHTEASAVLPADGVLGQLEQILADRQADALKLIEHDKTVATLRLLLRLPEDPSIPVLEAAWQAAEHAASAPAGACVLAGGRLADQAEALALAERQAKALDQRARSLGARIDAKGHTPQDLRMIASALRGSRPVLRWFSRAAREADKVVQQCWVGQGPLPDRTGCAELLEQWAELLEAIATFDANPLYRAWAGDDAPPSSADWVGIIARHHAWTARMHAMFSAEPTLRAAVESMDQAKLGGLAQLAPAARALRMALPVSGAARSWKSACGEAGRRVEAAQRALARARALGLPASLTVSHLAELIEAREVLGRAQQALAQPAMVALVGARDHRMASDVAAARATLAEAEAVLRTAPATIARRLLGSHRAAIIRHARRLLEFEQAAAGILRELSELGLAFSLSDPFDRLLLSISTLLAARAELPDWLRLAGDIAACHADPLAHIVLDAFVAADAPAAALPDAAEWLLLTVALRAHANAHRAVFDRTGSTLDSLRRQYAESDRARLRDDARRTMEVLMSRPIPRGNDLGPKRSWTDMACLDNEFAKQRGLLPLRELLTRAGGAVRALTPCLMMSPLTVAQFLKPDAPPFDLVVMDEASQIRPEDSLGALLRGAQAVIVGDTRQLPPTNFFDRALGDAADSEDDDQDDVTLAESVLDLARQAFRPPRLLRWHYRSRDPNLIAFSNRHFYEDRLIAFPAPHAPGGDLGIRLNEVMGTWQDRRNAEEARAVCAAARRIMHTEPNRSLAIVAMNAPQKELIEQEFEALTDTDEFCRAYRDMWDEEQEPFVVKNLENVQGDERDIILISLGWGRSPDASRPHQRFYPVNRAGGERRLNVLITRARRRLEVFASLRAEDVVVGENTPKGVRVLRDFLAYARDGRLERGTITGGDHESDFEESVASALRTRGHQVVAQVGVANYRIDLAVRDPRAPDRFMVGIECDGAMYHSARSARDRDRLRQKVLEDLGWRLLRVWSTDWYRAREVEAERLHANILQLVATAPPPETRALMSARETADPSPLAENSPPPEPPPRSEPAPALDAPPSSEPALAAEPAHRAQPTEPQGTPQERAAQALRQFRDSVLAVEFPHIPKENGLLRRSMIDAMVAAEVTTPDAFRQKVPLRLREKTDSAQLRYLPRICEIIGNNLE